MIKIAALRAAFFTVVTVLQEIKKEEFSEKKKNSLHLKTLVTIVCETFRNRNGNAIKGW